MVVREDCDMCEATVARQGDGWDDWSELPVGGEHSGPSTGSDAIVGYIFVCPGCVDENFAGAS